MSDNLRIWNAVSKTNPAHTKKVNQRGGFTSISASYQILAATEQFGPIGIGWGYETLLPIIDQGLIIVCVTIWHGSRENTFGPIPGCSDLLDHKGKVDSDAPKKAMTDGITKGLSQLGFNADVFLGKFDDNKYVAQMTREFAEEKSNVAPIKPQVDLSDSDLAMLGAIEARDTVVMLKKWKAEHAEAVKASPNSKVIIAAFDAQWDKVNTLDRAAS